MLQLMEHFKNFYDKDNMKNDFNKNEAVRILNEHGWVKINLEF